MNYQCPKDGCAGGNTPLPEAMAKAMGMKCPVCGTGLTPPQPSFNFSDWPAPVAIPLTEYYSEEHPGQKLWAACDTFEMLTRLLVIAFISGESQNGQLDEKLRKKLSNSISAPTFGQWFRMSQDLAESKTSLPALNSAKEYTMGTLKKL